MKWPRTLASRLALIFFTGLVLAYGLSFSLQAYERYVSSRSMMLSNLELDVSTSVAILDRLPAAERPAWLSRLSGAPTATGWTRGCPAKPCRARTRRWPPTRSSRLSATATV